MSVATFPRPKTCNTGEVVERDAKLYELHEFNEYVSATPVPGAEGGAEIRETCAHRSTCEPHNVVLASSRLNHKLRCWGACIIGEAPTPNYMFHKTYHQVPLPPIHFDASAFYSQAQQKQHIPSARDFTLHENYELHV